MMSNYYGVVPMKIVLNEKIDNNDLKLYIVISNLSNLKGYCYASNQYLAKVLKVSIRTIQYSIKKLEENEYIWVNKRKEVDTLTTKRRIYIQKEEENENKEELFNYDWLNE